MLKLAVFLSKHFFIRSAMTPPWDHVSYHKKSELNWIQTNRKDKCTYERLNEHDLSLCLKNSTYFEHNEIKLGQTNFCRIQITNLLTFLLSDRAY